MPGLDFLFWAVRHAASTFIAAFHSLLGHDESRSGADGCDSSVLSHETLRFESHGRKIQPSIACKLIHTKKNSAATDFEISIS